MKISFRSMGWLRMCLAVLLALALATAVIPLGKAGASGPVSGPFTPLRDPHGHTIRNLRSQLESSNWSGYVAAGYETGGNSYNFGLRFLGGACGDGRPQYERQLFFCLGRDRRFLHQFIRA